MRAATIETATEFPQTAIPERPDASIIVVSTAELAECTCPDWCERDHDRD